ncbi:MAG: lysine--tRNA ligase [Acidobacteria bacterium]|nr:lysine--tRNA ligase [Acidobacteriota bacterium]
MDRCSRSRECVRSTIVSECVSVGCASFVPPRFCCKLGIANRTHRLRETGRWPESQAALSFELELLEQRRAKLEQIEALGFAAYPYKFDFSHTVAQITEAYASQSAEELAQAKPEVRVCGRLQAIRGHGKAGFADLTQGGSRLQIYVRKDAVGERAFHLYELLDLGDLVGVEGYLFRTRTGELSVHVTNLTLLAKAMLPMPEKWHGLQDVEARYRQRYLDLLANPEVRKVFAVRSRLIRALRSAMERRGYIEVETPMMQPQAGGAAARPFHTHHNALDLDLYLRIAPELYLKRLVVGGFDRVYEINRNFRNEGISTHHNPEFTMLEFYQAYSDYRDLIALTEQLLPEVVMEACGTTSVEFGEYRIDFSRFHRYTMRQAIREFWPEDASRPAIEDFCDRRRTLAVVEAWNRLNPSQPLLAPPEETNGSTIANLFEAVCETKLVQPTFICEFPVEVSPLAKSKPDEPGWVERFELYVAGMEIANAYSELNDPEEQRKRFEAQMALREQGVAEAHGMDEDYIRALCYGMPPTAGEGIGIDRLTMLVTNSRSIRDVILFPLLRPETATPDGSQ